MMQAIYPVLNAFLAIFVFMVVVGLMLWVRNKSFWQGHFRLQAVVLLMGGLMMIYFLISRLS